ncbi:hypothetical protein IMCC3135_27300 [Granulosicoccus antarcticus IMCC3135]|uniref:DUF58 domain-containing protein n=2 Tax=Granulosicoccus TaxID=437504 RepID=A0A2Z2NYJ7_9GAMM|nr:hypothetical protein IMCC3135_27300 [Granulosicoccus antarcticus IMCC3135]
MLRQSAERDHLSFASPASTSLDELVRLRATAQAMRRQVRKKSAAPMNGGSVSKRLGRGLDFAEVREYQPGDDVRMIDWKVTARTGQAHTKLFVEERERPVLLVVDFRVGMRFGTRGMYKSVLAARLAALLGWSAVASNDRVGGFVFTDDWHSEIRPQAGRRGLMSLFRAIHQGQQRIPTQGGEQLARTLERLRHGVHAGSTVVLLSDFHGLDENARSALGSALQSLDVMAVHICDPLDVDLPEPGRYPMISNASGHLQRFVMAIGSKSEQQRYRDVFMSRQQVLRELFARHNHFYTTAMTDGPLRETVSAIIARQPDLRCGLPPA